MDYLSIKNARQATWEREIGLCRRPDQVIASNLSPACPEFKRLKDYDFADAKPASTFPHLVKHHLERLHQLTVQIDDDLVQWLANEVPPEKYAQIMNSALREFRKKRAA